MNGNRFDLLVFIGRFQPFHNGHLAVVRAGMARADRLLILIGSAGAPRSPRNPFTALERAACIRASLGGLAGRVALAALPDVPGDDAAWVDAVQAQVSATARTLFPEIGGAKLRVGLIDHSKDASSYYLRLFPCWGSVEVPDHEGLCATELRDRYFALPGNEAPDALLEQRVPAAVWGWLVGFTATAAFRQLQGAAGFTPPSPASPALVVNKTVR